MAAELGSRCLLEYQIQAPAASHSTSPRKRGKLVCGRRSAPATSAFRAVRTRSIRREPRALARCTDEPSAASLAASIQRARNTGPTVWRIHPWHAHAAGEAAVAAHPVMSPRLSRVLPNPSLKPRPNSQALGRRGRAVHHQPRRPSARLSGPA